MVKEIRIYIEGGGDGKNTKALIREGFSKFLQEIVELARSKKIKWGITVCGTRNNAFRDFKNALKSHPDAFNVLLVDAEAPVKKSPWEHLKNRDNWEIPEIDDRYCHLMVQAMELAVYEIIEDDGTYWGEIPILQGVWSNHQTLEGCRREFREALSDWLALRLRLGLMIPVIADIDLNKLTEPV